MTALIFGHDEHLAAWCAARIPHVGKAGFGPCRAVGVATGTRPDDKLLAVCVYHNWHPDYGVAEISFAASSPRWATRENIRRLLSVPFEQYGCRKVCTQTPSDNARAIKFNEGIGMRREAVLRHHFAPKRHAVIMSMMADEFRRKWMV